MSDISKNKFIASLGGMFAVGALAGALATSALNPHPAPLPDDRGKGPGPGRGGRPWKPLNEFVLENLRKELNLTAAQVTNIAPLTLQLEKEVDQIRANGFKEIGTLFGHFHTNSVLPLLNDEQKVLFEKMQENQRKWAAENSPRGGRDGRHGGSPKVDGKPPGDRPPEKRP
jgi:hypothetical protein